MAIAFSSLWVPRVCARPLGHGHPRKEQVMGRMNASARRSDKVSKYLCLGIYYLANGTIVEGNTVLGYMGDGVQHSEVCTPQLVFTYEI